MKRKSCNLSQEQLADRLGISRQAVSKWESGLSYPDMEKLMQLCKILNCTLDELLDDGVISEGVTPNIPSEKASSDSYLKDFLSFITRIYNMLCQMTWKDRFKCFFEMAFLVIVLVFLGFVCYYVLDLITYEILDMIPFQTRFLSRVFSSLYSVSLLVVGIIIFFHLFKIRYLDYFVTVEDKNVEKQTVEDPVEKQENQKQSSTKPQEKEKIIIRDPAHTPLRFFHLLSKALLLCIKFCIVFCAIPVAFLFIFFVFLFTASLFHVIYSSLFLWISLGILGGIGLCYVVLELAYRFIFNVKQAFKKLFIVVLISFCLIGIGAGITVCVLLSFDTTQERLESSYITDVQNIDFEEGLSFRFYCPYTYVVDEEEENIRLEITHLPFVHYDFGQQTSSDTSYVLHYKTTPQELYQAFLRDLGQKRLYSYTSDEAISVRLITSSKNFKQLGIANITKK